MLRRPARPAGLGTAACAQSVAAALERRHHLRLAAPPRRGRGLAAPPRAELAQHVSSNRSARGARVDKAAILHEGQAARPAGGTGSAA
eukprot:scaffold23736_cov60-Phaeocystis_antarctica.AAC.1